MKKLVTISTDPIADMLSRVRNALAVGKTELSLPHSTLKETIAKILVDQGFLASAKSVVVDGQKTLQIVTGEQNMPAKITQLSRLSTPGRRLYAKAGKIPTVKRGRGIVVVSTSAGVMTGSQAKAKKLGGELICRVY